MKTPDEMREWLLDEAQKEGEQYQEAKRKGWDTERITHYARVDMLARVLFMTGLADRRVTSDLLHRYLGNDIEDEQRPEE